MKDLMQLALGTAKKAGAQYCDVRYIRSESQRIVTRNGHVQSIALDDDSGFGVRVLAGGAWGFASSGSEAQSEIAKVAQEAVLIAKASARSLEAPVSLSPVEPVVDRWSAVPKIDPFEVKIEDKVETLLTAEELMRKSAPVSFTHGSLAFYKEDKHFMSSEGSDVRQTLTQSGGVIGAAARDEKDFQIRSYPAQFGGDFALAGWEHIENLDFGGNAQRVAREAWELLKAPQCPCGSYDLILEGSQLGLQIHESCGHPIELDRVLGMEAGMVGTSFLTPEKKGAFRYGSPSVNIVADATIPGANGSFGYDDDGVPGGRFDIVKEGIFEEYLTSRETAATLGGVSNGTNRATGWNRIPLVRMTNISIVPGDFTLDEIIQDTKRGIYMDLNRSYSIDDRRFNFQFGTELGYEIEDGSVTRVVKNPTYTGNTPEFWNSCDAVAGESEWKVWGIPNCGKGEPGQPIRVGHGAAPARFRNVRVGVGKW